MKIKKLLLIGLSVISFTLAKAQDNVGIGTTTPDNSAKLDVKSTNSGVLIPRVNFTQMTAIPMPATGLLVFNTDSNCFVYNSGTPGTPVWKSLCSAGGSGPAGPQGPVGATGPAGVNGATGAQGIAGATGPQGATGMAGTNGTNGTNGATGATGLRGATGPTGPQGSTGTAGTNGTAGPTGPQGVTGPPGPGGAGSLGPTGPTGPQGIPGVAGPQGIPGVAGAQGTTGPAGANGATGPAGTNGTNGINGATGPAGSQGPAGATGPQGVAGAAGTNGTNGINGATGPQGATGAKGTTGPAGPTGTFTGQAWLTNGNSGTNPPTNFIGTIDNKSFVTKTNNLERMRVFNNGQTDVNSTTLFTNGVFSVVGSGLAQATNNIGAYAINGYSAGYGIGVYGQNIGSGYGVYGDAPSASNAGYGVFGVSQSDSGNGVVGYNTVAGNGVLGQSTSGTGVLGFTNTGANFAVWGINQNINGTGVVGSGNNLTSFYMPQGSGGSFTGKRFGVTGFAVGAGTVTDIVHLAYSAGGYFKDSANPLNVTEAYVAAYNGGTDYKIIGNGAVSTLVKNLHNKDVIMFAPEAPEVLFEDYGEGELHNGSVHISLDPVFAKNVAINAKHPLRIFVQLEGNCKGVYVTNKTATGFDVKELQGGNSNVKFTYHVIANRKDSYVKGQLSSSYQDLRFPIFHRPLGALHKTMRKPSTINLKGRKIKKAQLKVK